MYFYRIVFNFPTDIREDFKKTQFTTVPFSYKAELEAAADRKLNAFLGFIKAVGAGGCSDRIV
jgi:hypothetical protein